MWYSRAGLGNHVEGDALRRWLVTVVNDPNASRAEQSRSRALAAPAFIPEAAPRAFQLRTT